MQKILYYVFFAFILCSASIIFLIVSIFLAPAIIFLCAIYMGIKLIKNYFKLRRNKIIGFLGGTKEHSAELLKEVYEKGFSDGKSRFKEEMKLKNEETQEN